MSRLSIQGRILEGSSQDGSLLGSHGEVRKRKKALSLSSHSLKKKKLRVFNAFSPNDTFTNLSLREECIFSMVNIRIVPQWLVLANGRWKRPFQVPWDMHHLN